jgi:hypothetical protein
MARVLDAIDDRLKSFLLAQPVFFVGTAATSPDQHVNVSPKGMAGTFAVLGPLRVAYLDYLASGAETIAHLRDNGRITIMCCAFNGPPNIVRLHGTGRVVLPRDPDFKPLLEEFPQARVHGLRSIIDVVVDRVSDSCGFAVPLLDHVGDRDLLVSWASRKDDAELCQYAETKNLRSIDGLPALTGLAASFGDQPVSG